VARCRGRQAGRLKRVADERRQQEQTRTDGERKRADGQAAQERAKAMQAQAAAQRADREMMDEWSQVPRCFSSGFPVGTRRQCPRRCERIRDFDGAPRPCE